MSMHTIIESELAVLEEVFERAWDAMLSAMGSENEPHAYREFLEHYEALKLKDLQLDTLRPQ